MICFDSSFINCYIDNKSEHRSKTSSENEDDGVGNSPKLTDYMETRWYRSPELLLVSDGLPYGK